LRLSHSDLTNENAILHHKQLGRILLGCKRVGGVPIVAAALVVKCETVPNQR